MRAQKKRKVDIIAIPLNSKLFGRDREKKQCVL